VVVAKGTEIELRDLPSVLVNMETRPRQGNVNPTIIESEERLIREVLDACGGNKAEAARQLGISRSTLYEKVKKFIRSSIPADKIA
jgi:transcriptional regulator of acetoin/glycerol metabolism